MARYVARRIMLLVPAWLIMGAAAFALIRLIPGDPAAVLLGMEATPQAVAELRVRLGLDQPLPVQFVLWLSRVVQGELGRSFFLGQPVLDAILGRLPVTLSLTAAALACAVLIGVPIGVRAATRPNSPTDLGAMAAAVVGLSVPDFALGLGLIVLFGVALQWLPVSGYVPLSRSPAGFVQHLILPALALGMPQGALIARITRSSMLEALGADYVRTARAKGLAEPAVVGWHAFRNTLIHVLTVVGSVGRRAPRGSVRGRDRLQPAGAGQPGGHGGEAARLSAGPGLPPADLHDGHPGQPRRRRALRLSRSPDPVWLKRSSRGRGVDAPAGHAVWRRLGRHRLALAGGAIVLVVATLAVALPVVIATDPTALDVQATLTSPSRRHWFGTDDFGRDLFARVVHGIRLSLLVGSSVLVVTVLLGAVPGLVAGFVPRADAVIMRVMDALMAFPAILLALSVMAIAGPSTVNVVGALGVAYAPRMARLARASVLAVRSREFVDAARALGNRPLRVLARHVTPNAAAPVIVQGTFTVGYAILGEAALSFVGLGAVPPTPSLGNILADARVFLRDAPWMILCPAATLALLILGLNLLGDGIRDALDPRTRI